MSNFLFLFEKNFEIQSIETYNSMLQKILSLIDEVKINEVFTELDKANIQSPQINRLRQEFVHGRIDFDFYDRLKTAVRNELKVSQNSEQETMPINDSKSNQTQFWIQFLAEAKRCTNLFANKNPNPEKTARDGWMDTASGMTAVFFEVRIHKTYARVCLYINKPTEESKAIFDELYQSKAAIERSFGSTLAWERKEGKQHSRIDYILNIDTENKANWTKINDFLINNLVKLVQVLTPYLKKIKRSNTGEKVTNNTKEVVSNTLNSMIFNFNSDDKIKILFVAANPTDQARIQTDKEHRIIKAEMERGSHRDFYKFLDPQFSVTITELLRAVNQKPQIIHFSGHGETAGIIISTDNNNTQLVPISALERIFKPLKESTKIVILNSCYSAEQAKVISNFGMCIVGNNLPIGDGAAISFAKGLYNGLSEGKSFNDACNDAMIVLTTEYANYAHVVEIWKDGQKLDI